MPDPHWKNDVLMLLPTVVFNDKFQHFEHLGTESVEDLVGAMNIPLSLTFKLTRGCNLSCVYCSEPPGIRTRSYEEVLAMIDKLHGMRRIIFSGGEPMLYKRFWDVLEYSRDRFEKSSSRPTRQGSLARTSNGSRG